jgi:hypothetical protein
VARVILLFMSVFFMGVFFMGLSFMGVTFISASLQRIKHEWHRLSPGSLESSFQRLQLPT